MTNITTPSASDSGLNLDHLEALAPCPFCGGPAKTHPTATMHMVECDNADCGSNPDVLALYKHEAIAAWNRRAAPVSAPQQIETVAMTDRIDAENYRAMRRVAESRGYASISCAIKSAPLRPVLEGVKDYSIQVDTRAALANQPALTVDMRQPTEAKFNEFTERYAQPAPTAAPEQMTAGDVELIRVPAHEADSYCRILSILGMEEEGDPVAEVQRLFDAAAPAAGDELHAAPELNGRITGAHACFSEAMPPGSLTSIEHAHVYKALQAAIAHYVAHQPAQEQAEPVAWSYECLQPGGKDVWCEFISRTKPWADRWTRNIRPLYAAPFQAAQHGGAALASESAETRMDSGFERGAGQAAQHEAGGIPDILFDGKAVYDEIVRKVGKSYCGNPSVVSDTLDAVVRLMKSETASPVVRAQSEESGQAHAGADEDGERWRFMMAVADDPEGAQAKAMEQFGRDDESDDTRPESVQMAEIVDKARAAIRAAQEGGKD